MTQILGGLAFSVCMAASPAGAAAIGFDLSGATAVAGPLFPVEHRIAARFEVDEEAPRAPGPSPWSHVHAGAFSMTIAPVAALGGLDAIVLTGDLEVIVTDAPATGAGRDAVAFAGASDDGWSFAFYLLADDGAALSDSPPAALRGVTRAAFTFATGAVSSPFILPDLVPVSPCENAGAPRRDVHGRPVDCEGRPYRPLGAAIEIQEFGGEQPTSMPAPAASLLLAAGLGLLAARRGRAGRLTPPLR